MKIILVNEHGDCSDITERCMIDERHVFGTIMVCAKEFEAVHCTIEFEDDRPDLDIGDYQL